MIFVFAFSNMNSKSKIQSVKIFYIKGIVEIIKFISGNTKELRVTIQKNVHQKLQTTFSLCRLHIPCELKDTIRLIIVIFKIELQIIKLILDSKVK